MEAPSFDLLVVDFTELEFKLEFDDKFVETLIGLGCKCCTSCVGFIAAVVIWFKPAEPFDLVVKLGIAFDLSAAEFCLTLLRDKRQ